jgi:hydroxymethylpyrimidine/phosphomethylpyrimidine kinase
MKKVMLIGGSDSGAGAGVQADLKTVTALGVYGTTVITALTAQNTLGVQDIYPVPPAFVAQQIDSVMQDIGTDALKTGMLLEKEIVKVVAEKICKYGIEKVIVDPVILAKGGYPLLNEDALEVLKSALISFSLLVTPNVNEAERLSGVTVTGTSDLKEAAKRLHALGARNVLIKGGHLTGEEAQDLLYDGREFTTFTSPRIPGVSIHGSGCMLASSISAGLAKGQPLKEAIRLAREFLQKAMLHPLSVGKGHEVIDPAQGLTGPYPNNYM